MGLEARRGIGAKSKKAAPPYFSHEFVILNHGDIMSCILMLIIGGFLFQATLPFAQFFVMPQYNTTFENATTAPPAADASQPVFYRAGFRDIGQLFFYTVVWIVVHCVLQEYVVDKVQRRFHMSRTRLARFSESAILAPFALYSAVHAAYILYELGVHKDFTLLWNGYPESHRYFPIFYKFFFIFQISFWLHQFPEFYFQRLKKDEINERSVYSFLFLGFITAAYFTNFTRLALALLAIEYTSLAVLHASRLFYFMSRSTYAAPYYRVWNVLFIAVRLSSMVISVLVLWYGMRAQETPYVDFEKGNFNTHLIRLNALFFLLLTQLHMIYQYARFHFGRWSAKSNQQDAQTKRKSNNANKGAAKKEEKKVK